MEEVINTHTYMHVSTIIKTNTNECLLSTQDFPISEVLLLLL